jgi:hypothetical protein
MDRTFPALERTILTAKGLSEAQLAALEKAGVAAKADFATIGDAATLAEVVPGLPAETAARVMAWATGAAIPAGGGGAGKPMLIDSADLVYCVHCAAKQPKDYKSGDLCVACGKQAEAILSCYWCLASGPGKFCRACGAEFIATADLDLAILLKREGSAKDDVPRKLRALGPADREALWGRIRKSRA